MHSRSGAEYREGITTATYLLTYLLTIAKTTVQYMGAWKISGLPTTPTATVPKIVWAFIAIGAV